MPVDKVFAPSGNGVISQRTADHVGFNGFSFRKVIGFPELRNKSSPLIQRAWPKPLLRPYGLSETGELVYGVDSLKCAPEN